MCIFLLVLLLNIKEILHSLFLPGYHKRWPILYFTYIFPNVLGNEQISFDANVGHWEFAL